MGRGTRTHRTAAASARTSAAVAPRLPDGLLGVHARKRNDSGGVQGFGAVERVYTLDLGGEAGSRRGDEIRMFEGRHGLILSQDIKVAAGSKERGLRIPYDRLSLFCRSVAQARENQGRNLVNLRAAAAISDHRWQMRRPEDIDGSLQEVAGSGSGGMAPKQGGSLLASDEAWAAICRDVERYRNERILWGARRGGEPQAFDSLPAEYLAPREHAIDLDPVQCQVMRQGRAVVIDRGGEEILLDDELFEHSIRKQLLEHRTPVEQFVAPENQLLAITPSSEQAELAEVKMPRSTAKLLLAGKALTLRESETGAVVVVHGTHLTSAEREMLRRGEQLIISLQDGRPAWLRAVVGLPAQRVSERGTLADSLATPRRT